MSRVANRPIFIPDGVLVSLNEQVISVSGSKGNFSWILPCEVKVCLDNNLVKFEFPDYVKAMAGTSRALINNFIIGVSSGFEKTLELIGVGYRAQTQADKLILSLGFSHPIEVIIPTDIQVLVEKNTVIIIKGVDKQKVGEFCAKIRRFRPPEPYKGKGVRYKDEFIVRKEGKKK